MMWVFVVLALAVGLGAGFVGRRLMVSSRVQTAETRAQRVVLEAEREAQTKVQEALVEVKQEIAAMRREAEEDIRTRREEVQRSEQRLTAKEASAERKLAE